MALQCHGGFGNNHFEGLANVFLFFFEDTQPKDRARIASRRANDTSGRTKDVGEARGMKVVISRENGGWLPEHYLMVKDRGRAKRKKDRSGPWLFFAMGISVS